MRLYNWNVCSAWNLNNINRFILWRYIISYLSLELSWLGNSGFLVFNWYWSARNSFKWNNNITFFKRFFLQILLFGWVLISFIRSKVFIWIWLDNSFFFFCNLSSKWIFNWDSLSFDSIFLLILLWWFLFQRFLFFNFKF
jgi:hypothetical protein